MSARRAAVSKARTQAEARRLNPMVEFVWQGRDKRGVVMKGEQLAKNANLLRTELRKQGITPTAVKPKPKPLFGGSAKKISARDIAIFSRQRPRRTGPLDGQPRATTQGFSVIVSTTFSSHGFTSPLVWPM